MHYLMRKNSDSNGERMLIAKLFKIRQKYLGYMIACLLLYFVFVDHFYETIYYAVYTYFIMNIFTLS